MKRRTPSQPVSRQDRRRPVLAAAAHAERRIWRVFEYRRPQPAAPRFTL
jgi:hypothetical protein